MPEFSVHSRIHEVVGAREDGRDLLYQHGYDIGAGFVDLLSQQQSIEDAARGGRLRDLAGLLAELNRD